MTSREIAELTGKRHDHVTRDIRTMLTELHGEGGVLKFRDTYLNNQNGQTYPCFRFPKREACLMASRMETLLLDRALAECVLSAVENQPGRQQHGVVAFGFEPWAALVFVVFKGAAFLAHRKISNPNEIIG